MRSIRWAVALQGSSARFEATDSEAIDFRAASESFVPIRRLNKKDLDILTRSRLVDPRPPRVVSVGASMPAYA